MLQVYTAYRKEVEADSIRKADRMAVDTVVVVRQAVADRKEEVFDHRVG